MEKKFIDYMYEQRALVQADIDRLVEIQKQPINSDDDSKSIMYEKEAELRTRRSQIQGINHTIQKYFDTHKNK